MIGAVRKCLAAGLTLACVTWPCRSRHRAGPAPRAGRGAAISGPGGPPRPASKLGPYSQLCERGRFI